MRSARFVIVSIAAALAAASAAFSEAGPADTSETGASRAAFEATFLAGRYPEAAALARARLDALRASASPAARVARADSAAIALALIDLGRALKEYADLAESEVPLREAVAIERALRGGPHPGLGDALEEQARCVEWRGDPDRADTLASEALTIRRAAAEVDSVALARNLELVAAIRAAQARNVEAESLARAAIDIQDRHLGDHLDTAASLVVLGRQLAKLDKIDESVRVLRRAVVIRRTILGAEHPWVADAQKWLAISYFRRGDVAQSEVLLREALAVQRRFFGNEHDIVLGVLGNLSLPLDAMGKHEDALEVMLECLRIHRATDTENFQRVARLYANIGRQYAALGRYAEAEQIVLDGLAGLRREGLEKHQNTDYLRETLASIYFRQLRLDAARAEAESVLALHEMRVGEAHRSVVAAHTLLGQIALEEGDLPQARTHFERAARSFELDRVRMGTGISASTFLLRESPYELVSAVSAELGDWRMAWESIERTRGRALNEMIRSSQDLALSESDRKERDARRSDLLAALDSLTAARRAGEGIAEAENGLFVAQNRWEQLQSDLAMRPGAVGQPTVSLERVQRSLRAHEAILGWVEASQGARNRQRVWAYLIRNTGGVVWAPVDPPDASTPRAQADSFRDALEAPSRSAFGTGMDATLAEHEQALGAMWAGPLLEHMEGVEALIVVPSASISGIPIEALRDGDGTPLGDRFVVSYAPSATVLSWLAERPADRDARANALFVGDPPFRAVHAAAMVSAENAAPSSGRLDEIVLRDALYADPEALGKLPRLAWSRREVESASKSFAKSEVLVGPRACEPALRSLATEEQLHDFDVVHVATHALIDANDPLKSALVLSQLPADDEQGGADPLDGLLTGAEIAHGWKLDADLVTLSSCETATGRLAKGEGTIGFAYPFLAVGARCMLLSLWKVDDEATALLMQRFYENWRGADGSAREGGRGRDGAMTKAEALREAKHWLRSLEDDGGNRRFEHPYYWSAFVLIGDAG